MKLPPHAGVPDTDYRRQLSQPAPSGVQFRCALVCTHAGSTVEARLKQEVQTDTISRANTRMHWRVLLPVAMLVLSAFLMGLAEKQQPMLWGMGTGWEVPARVINSLVNGPGFYLTGVIPLMPTALNRRLSYDADRLFGIALFWFLIGLSIDRRANKQALDQRHPIRAGVLFTFTVLVCGFLGVGLGIVAFRDPTFWRLVAEYPLRTEQTMKLGFVVWLLVFCGYFTKRAFIAASRRLQTVA